MTIPVPELSYRWTHPYKCEDAINECSWFAHWAFAKCNLWNDIYFEDFRNFFVNFWARKDSWGYWKGTKRYINILGDNILWQRSQSADGLALFTRERRCAESTGQRHGLLSLVPWTYKAIPEYIRDVLPISPQFFGNVGNTSLYNYASRMVVLMSREVSQMQTKCFLHLRGRNRELTGVCNSSRSGCWA